MPNARLTDLLAECTVRVGTKAAGGTGFFVAPGVILTCAHVVNDSTAKREISVQWQSMVAQATIVDVLPDLDIAVLEVVLDGHPCVMLGEDQGLDSELYGYGYPVRNGSVRGDSLRPVVEGPTHFDDENGRRTLLKLAHTQVEPGYSGAPLLDRDSGLVCAIVKATRDRTTDLGGRAIPVSLLLQRRPSLGDRNRQFHTADKRWVSAVAVQNLEPDSALVRGIQELPADYAGRIRKFISSYIGTADKPEPFGGRRKELSELTNWLEDRSAAPYHLVAAPAGRGKSALLVQWCRTLLEREWVAEQQLPTRACKTHVVFLPISIRYQTNLPSVTFAALAAQLAAIRNEPLPRALGMGPEEWEAHATRLLERAPSDGSTTLVVLDGLDEAAEWEPGPHLFPDRAPDGLKVLVSARLTRRRPTEDHWLATLGWSRGIQAITTPLNALDADGLADILTRMGVPLDELATRPEILSELLRLTTGDPLLVNLYVKDLWASRDSVQRLTVGDLAQLEPGLEGYFERWWEDQRELWRKHHHDHAPLREQATRTLLNLLSCALGPLKRADLLRLGRTTDGLEHLTFDDAILPLDRFVVQEGSENGYVFSHPKLAEYHYDQLREAEEQYRWDDVFLEWGRQVTTALAESRLRAEDAPEYVVMYFGAHLERAKAPVNDFMTMLSEAWRRAWQRVDQSFAGYLGDVQRVWDRLATSNSADDTPLTIEGAELRCAAIHSSVVSAAERVPAEVLKRLVQEGIRDDQQVRAYAARIVAPFARAQALTAVASAMPKGRQDSTFLSALAVIERLENREEQHTSLVGWLKDAPTALLMFALPILTKLRTQEQLGDDWDHLMKRLPPRDLPALWESVIGCDTPPDYRLQRTHTFFETLAKRLKPHDIANILAVIKTVTATTAVKCALLRALQHANDRRTYESWYTAYCEVTRDASELHWWQVPVRLEELDEPVDLDPLTRDLPEWEALLATQDHAASRVQRSMLATALAAAMHLPDKRQGSAGVVCVLDRAGRTMARTATASLVMKWLVELPQDVTRCGVARACVSIADDLTRRRIHQLMLGDAPSAARAGTLEELAKVDRQYAATAVVAIEECEDLIAHAVLLGRLCAAGTVSRSECWELARRRLEARAVDDTYRTALQYVARWAPEQGLAYCLDRAPTIAASRQRRALLNVISKRATGEVLERLLTMASLLADYDGALILRGCSDRLPANMTLRAMNVFAELRDEEAITLALPSIAQVRHRRTSQLLWRGLHRLSTRARREKALVGMLGALDGGEAEECALLVSRSLVEGIGSTDDAETALGALLTRLPECGMEALVGGMRADIWRRHGARLARRAVDVIAIGDLVAVLRMAAWLENETERDAVLNSAYARWKAEGEASHVARWLVEAPEMGRRVLALCDVAELRSMLGAASSLSMEPAGAAVAVECARKLPTEEFGSVLAACDRLRDENHRAEVLRALAERLPSTEPDPILERAFLIAAPNARLRVLDARSLVLDKQERRRLWEREVEASQRIGDQLGAVAALCETQRLEGGKAGEGASTAALRILVLLANVADKARALLDVAALAPVAEWPTVLKIAKELPREHQQATALQLLRRCSMATADVVISAGEQRDVELLLSASATAPETERCLLLAIAACADDDLWRSALRTAALSASPARLCMLLDVAGEEGGKVDEELLVVAMQRSDPGVDTRVEKHLSALTATSRRRMRKSWSIVQSASKSEDEAADDTHRGLNQQLVTQKHAQLQALAERLMVENKVLDGATAAEWRALREAVSESGELPGVTDTLASVFIKLMEGRDARRVWRTLRWAGAMLRSTVALRLAAMDRERSAEEWEMILGLTAQELRAATPDSGSSNLKRAREVVVARIADETRRELLGRAGEGAAAIWELVVRDSSPRQAAEEWSQMIVVAAEEARRLERWISGGDRSAKPLTERGSVSWRLSLLASATEPHSRDKAIAGIGDADDAYAAIVGYAVWPHVRPDARARIMARVERMGAPRLQSAFAQGISGRVAREDAKYVTQLGQMLRTAGDTAGLQVLFERLLHLELYREAWHVSQWWPESREGRDYLLELLRSGKHGDHAAARTIWRAALWRLSRLPREELFRDFPNLCECARGLAGTSAVREATESLQLVEYWWP
jgi:hypothetical protein